MHRCVLSCVKQAILLLVAISGYASTVVLLRTTNTDTLEERQIRQLAQFYGLDLEIVDVSSTSGLRHASSLVNDPATLALLTRADALRGFDLRRTAAVLGERKGKRIPVMVFGINDQTDRHELQRWSHGAVRSCNRLGASFRPRVIEVAQVDSLTRQLSGLALPAISSPVCALESESDSSAKTVLTVRGGDGATAVLLIRTLSQSRELFFVPQLILSDSSWAAKPTALAEAFSSMVPFLLFLSSAAGDYAWHLDGHYANLTIDDPWLIQPYGYLDYAALSVEMEKHNFHTTIAFVPWNFDRSESDVVTIFRSRPSRYSICLHGNNHAHREFGDYRGKPLSGQVADIRQAIARMERFSALTQLPYDRFMVFPHGVAPEATFAALNAYGFLGTANASNVPLGSSFPEDPTFLLRPYTANYGRLLSLSRYPASGEIPALELAIQSFLGNPILFYDHENLFEHGIGAFSKHADFVNQIQQDTQWTSLGEIARHCYLLRRRTDGNFDVRMLSNEMKLTNTTDTALAFYVQRTPDSGIANTLTVDGEIVPQSPSHTRLVIPAHESRKVIFASTTNVESSTESLRSGVYVYALRMVSDYRDIYLSRSSWGSILTKIYYQRHWDSAELYLERNWWLLVVAILLLLAGARYCRLTLWPRRKRNAEI